MNTQNTQNKQKYCKNVFYPTTYIVEHWLFVAVIRSHIYSITCKFVSSNSFFKFSCRFNKD